MRKLAVCIVVLLVCLQVSSFALVRFGVGLQWMGDTDMAMGFDFGAGSKDFGVDVTHFGLQPTLYSYGTVELSQNRIGVYYCPFDFLMVQAGLHDTKLNLSQDKQEVLGTKTSAVWSGPYVMLSFPLHVEESYFVKPFYGIMSVDGGKRTESAIGIALGAEFEPTENKVLF